jgi:hypothetical protein
MENNGGQCCDFLPVVMNIFSDNQFLDQGNKTVSRKTFCRARLPSMDQFSIIDNSKAMCCI